MACGLRGGSLKRLAGVWLGGASLMVALPAAADLFVSAHVPGLCLGKKGGDAALERCSPQSDLGYAGYGQIRRDNLCLATQHEGEAAANRKGPRDFQLIWEACANETRQRWGIQTSGRLRGSLRNEQGWCANIRGAARNDGAPIIAWECKGDSNEKWQTGTWKANSVARDAKVQYQGQTMLLDQLVSDVLNRRQVNGANVIAMGGANVIAMGGGNVIAMGGANVIAAGGANVIAAGGGNLINPGNLPGGNMPGSGKLIGPGIQPGGGRADGPIGGDPRFYRPVDPAPVPPKFTFASPRYQQVLKAGEPLEVVWRKEGGTGAGAALFLVSENRDVARLRDLAMADGRYVWNVPADMRRGVYRLVVRAGDKEIGNSADFTIEPAAANAVPMGLSHSARGPVREGDNVTLNWRIDGYTGDVMARIHLRAGDEIVKGLPHVAPRGGSMAWTVPSNADLKPGVYRFSLTLASGTSAPSKVVYSDALTVVPTTVVKPEMPESGACRDGWVAQAVLEVTGHAARGKGDEGECDYRRYGGGSWSSYPDLVQKVRQAFAQSAPVPSGNTGPCADPWVGKAVEEVTRRPVQGRGGAGECNINLYGAQWGSYTDLVDKVRQTVRALDAAGLKIAPGGNALDDRLYNNTIGPLSDMYIGPRAAAPRKVMVVDLPNGYALAFDRRCRAGGYIEGTRPRNCLP